MLLETNVGKMTGEFWQIEIQKCIWFGKSTTRDWTEGA